MEKWEQQLKNDVNRSVPTMIDVRVEETLRRLPRKKTVKKKIYYGLSAAAVAVLMTFGLSVISPSFANTIKEIPIIGSAFEFVGNIGVKKGKEEGLTTELGEQIEIDGQLITFTETLYDGGEIHIGYIAQRNEDNTNPHFMNHLELFIDGKRIGSYGMGGNESKIENGMYAGTISIRVREEIPDSFVLGIRPHEGKSWSVELQVEMKGEHQTFIVNKVEQNDDLSILFDKVNFFPTSTEISLRLVMDEEAFSKNKYRDLGYVVIDDKGRVLQPFSGGGGGGGPVNGKVIHNFKQYYEPLQPTPETITIKPYLMDFSESAPTRKRVKWEGEKITLSQGEIGHLTVLESSEENNVKTFTYEVQGEDLYSQATAIWLEDSNGNWYHSEQPAVRVDGTVNQYQVSFTEFPSSDDTYVSTVKMDSPNFIEELETTIDFTKID
ncbi:DUF4179 domain-containing protein [Bacillus dakarensis]|uniref:DUF4179 domain-containing protein n=1 Tax=Robertmurraya dakarensis TaxID=1926278 RepID=UPI00098253BD|nr:DUF4179 domain-containing protein [Bacillus dakarensis]